MKSLRNQSGQMFIETILVMMVLLGAIYFVGKEFRSNNFVAGLVSGPWKNLAGMIQNGVWGSPTVTMKMHPNRFERVVSPEGVDAK